MNINIFFLVISTGLLVVFIGFKPMNVKQQEFVDVPLFELMEFTLYELNQDGLVTIMKGNKATRYEDRYKVTNIDYTDNSKKYMANMRADKGLYKDKNEVLDLKDNVIYNREDGFIFETEKINYNKVTSIAKTNKKYVMYKDDHKITGTSLIYNNSSNKIASKNIIAIYHLKEEK